VADRIYFKTTREENPTEVVERRRKMSLRFVNRWRIHLMLVLMHAFTFLRRTSR